MFSLKNVRYDKYKTQQQNIQLLLQENAILKSVVTSMMPKESSVPTNDIKPFYTYLKPCATAQPNDLIANIPPLYYCGPQLIDLYSIPQAIAPVGKARKVVIAVVVAYHYNNLLADLATYWTNPVNFGASSKPPNVIVHNLNAKNSTSSNTSISTGWAQEECLDLQMVCTVCPNADIRVVEANSDSIQDINAAVAFALGSNVNADVISMSWGGTDSPSYSSYSSTYTSNRNVCLCASSGDSNSACWPSVLSNCISVGGTTLVWSPTATSHSARTEYVWPNAGCGYSTVVPTPSYQTAVNTTGRRSIPDISMIANPQTSMYMVYAGAWYGIGGTSVSAPIFSATLALANQLRLNAGKPTLTTIYNPAGPNTYSVQSRLYAVVNTPAYSQIFNDITIGQDKGTNSSGATVIYNAGIKYDIATGLGSPNIGAMINLLNSF